VPSMLYFFALNDSKIVFAKSICEGVATSMVRCRVV
jgi:hypothetical protein